MAIIFGLLINSLRTRKPLIRDNLEFFIRVYCLSAAML